MAGARVRKAMAGARVRRAMAGARARRAMAGAIGLNTSLFHRFGAYLVSRQLALVGDIITVFFSILIGAFNLGQSAPNLQKIVEAQGAAGPIYDIIDRVRVTS